MVVQGLSIARDLAGADPAGRARVRAVADRSPREALAAGWPFTGRLALEGGRVDGAAKRSGVIAGMTEGSAPAVAGPPSV